VRIALLEERALQLHEERDALARQAELLVASEAATQQEVGTVGALTLLCGLLLSIGGRVGGESWVLGRVCTGVAV
jgi:hypothetical protein